MTIYLLSWLALAIFINSTETKYSWWQILLVFLFAPVIVFGCIGLMLGKEKSE